MRSSVLDAAVAVLVGVVAAVIRVVWRLAERVSRLEGSTNRPPPDEDEPLR